MNPMKIFIDTANLDMIKEINSWGILDGVTTNPSLIAKEGVDVRTRVREIAEIVDGPISAEAMSTTAEEMVKEGRELAAIHPNINVKLPMCVETLKATKILASEGIRVNVTLIFSPLQALLAAKAGAAFVSPFIGRLDDWRSSTTTASGPRSSRPPSADPTTSSTLRCADATSRPSPTTR